METLLISLICLFFILSIYVNIRTNYVLEGYSAKSIPSYKWVSWDTAMLKFWVWDVNKLTK